MSAYTPRLEQTLKMAQQLILSPQMQQAIQILQMPIMELRAKIAEEMVNNPLLEEKADVKSSLDDALSKTPTEKEEFSKDEGEFSSQFSKLSELDDEWKNYYSQTNSIRKYNSQDDEKRRFMESSISVSESLQEHLYSQLNLIILDNKENKIAEFIIGSIDNNGYLSLSNEQICETLNCNDEEVEKVISKIQKFTPIGVGARNLKECLFIQINNLPNEKPFVRDIIEYHLDDLSKHKFPQIAKALKASLTDIQNACTFISSLEPKPGRIFGNDTITYITPDIYIEEKDGEYEVTLEDSFIPHLHISNMYKKLMNSDDTGDETQDYIRNKVRSGMWLIKNIQQRQQTIHKIMKKIVEMQKPFFKDGVGHLIPMTMQEIASQLSIHESTVSRAISKKYVQTPQGLFPVKYFFSSEMRTVDGGSTSSRNIKQKIQEIINNEDSKTPLSDFDIITILKKEGIILARRTVSKYRKELNIPSSNLRRKY